MEHFSFKSKAPCSAHKEKSELSGSGDDQLDPPHVRKMLTFVLFIISKKIC